MANSKLVSTKYLLRLRRQEEWEGWHFRAKAHFRKSGAWRLISEGHPRDTGNRIQVELPDYRERVLVQHRNLRRIFAGQPDRIAQLIPRLPQLPRWLHLRQLCGHCEPLAASCEPRGGELPRLAEGSHPKIFWVPESSDALRWHFFLFFENFERMQRNSKTRASEPAETSAIESSSKSGLENNFKS